MSVLIKHMAMPKGCIYANDKDQTDYCPMLNHDDVPFCQYIENEPEIAIGIDERPVYCPLSDVPDTNVEDMISRQAAMESLMGKNVIMDGSEYHNGFNAGVNRAQEVIRNLPSVQTEIIHCKNCAFYEKEIGGNDGFALGMCKFIEQHYVTNEGFCFWAKKKGE